MAPKITGAVCLFLTGFDFVFFVFSYLEVAPQVGQLGAPHSISVTVSIKALTRVRLAFSFGFFGRSDDSEYPPEVIECFTFVNS